MMRLCFSFIAVVLLAGCPIGGRWDRYSGGGSFIGGCPDCSPDGSNIIFASPETGHGDIYQFNEGTGTFVRLTEDPGYEGDPEYSPDGSKIVFVREEDLIGHIWIMNADGTAQLRITNAPGYDSGPSFSPDGSRIVFTRNVAERKFRPGTAASAEIFVANVDGTGETRLTNNEQADWEASFSPDGEKIIYSVWSDDVWCMNSDGSSPQRLIAGSSPSYSADGSQVVFVSGQYGRDLSIMNADGTDVNRIYASKSYKSHPTFCPDGIHVVFLEESGGRGIGDICRLKRGDDEVERIAATNEIQ